MNVISNAKWNAFSQLFKVLIQLINLVYLATIIPPSEYGIMAMAAVVVNFGILLRDIGTSAALIQKKQIDEKLKNTVYWLNLILGVSLAIAICILSPIVASLYRQSELIPILCILSIIFPFSSSAATHLALLERESQFRKISTIEIASSVISVVVAVASAKLGFGVYSLVFQALALNIVSCVLFLALSNWRPSIELFVSRSAINEIFGFSANLTIFNFINYFSRNLDSFLIGRYMTAAILGSYNLAYRIMLFPIQSLTFVVSRSLFPVLSHYQDDTEKVRTTYLNCVYFVLMISAPLMLGIAVYSELIVSLFFGEKWGLTAEIFKWLAPTAILQSVLSTTGSVFMSKGRANILMQLGFLGAFLQVGAFLLGINYDIKTFASFYFVANLINFFPVMYKLLDLIDSSFRQFFKKISPICFSSFVMTATLLLLNYNFSHIIGNNTMLIFVGGLTGLITYYLCLLVFSSEFRGLNKKIFIFKK